ncbi:MAG: hypothetical protein ACE5GW_13675 [Planctomycetota bacterium]
MPQASQFTVGLYQAEVRHLHNPPHLGSALFIADLERAGFRVDRALVNIGHIDALADRIAERGVDLAAIDSNFRVAEVNRLKERNPGVPIVIGNSNALQLLLASDADYAVAGPGRRAMVALARALESGGQIEGVPNLFLRAPSGEIDHTGVEVPWEIEGELLPFEPDLEWDYLGPEREPGSDIAFVSVVPELGCSYNTPASRNSLFKGLPEEPAAERSAPGEPPLTERAFRVVERLYLDEMRGCSFCIFRFQPYVTPAVERSVDLVRGQLAYLTRRYGITTVAVQSEHPFRFLVPLLEMITREFPGIREIHLRTLPKLLIHGRKPLEAGLEMARDRGVKLGLVGLGFESFHQGALDRFNKGIQVAENLDALEILSEIHRRFGPETVDPFHGHGLILFHPWTTPEELLENLRVVETHPFLIPSFTIDSRLTIDSRFQSIYFLARRDGAVAGGKGEYGWDFHHLDPRIPPLIDAFRRLSRILRLDLDGRPSLGGAERRTLYRQGNFTILARLIRIAALKGKESPSLTPGEERELGELIARLTGR